MNKILKNQQRKYDFAVFGRVTIDLNPLDFGKTLDQSANFMKYLGGSAGNIAVGLSRLGLKTAMVSCVSQDQHGKFLQDYMQKTKINIEHVQVASHGQKTGLTFTEMKSDIESSILMYRNNVADLALMPVAGHELLIKNSNAIIISGTALSKSPSREAILHAIMLAEKHHTPIVFDIDYRPYTWTNKIETNIYYSLVAKKADIIIGSKEEFDLAKQLVHASKNDQDLANYFFSKKAKLVIIKYGSQGSLAFINNGDVYKIAIFPIQLLKSFGGGDAYISALLYGLMNQHSIEKSLTYASAHAAHVVASHSCSDGLMTQQELQDFLAKHQESLPVVKKINKETNL